MCSNTVTGYPVRKVVSNLIPVSQYKSDVLDYFQLLLYFLNAKHIQIQTRESKYQWDVFRENAHVFCFI